MYIVAQLPIDMLKEQLMNGVILMGLGMAIVFVFLTILVFSTKLVSKIVKKFETKKTAALAAPAPVVAPSVSSNDAEVAVAIAAAMAKKN